MSEIEIYVQGKRFVAKNLEEVDECLKRFKPWNTLGGEMVSVKKKE